jgi:hypothetical protein
LHRFTSTGETAKNEPRSSLPYLMNSATKAERSMCVSRLRAKSTHITNRQACKRHSIERVSQVAPLVLVSALALNQREATTGNCWFGHVVVDKAVTYFTLRVWRLSAPS